MLTVARIRGEQALLSTEDKAVERLEGMVPVNDDWHSRTTLLKVHCILSNIIFNTYNPDRNILLLPKYYTQCPYKLAY